MAGTVTINYFQTINATVAGVANAPLIHLYPTQINSADLPFVITWGGDATINRKGGAGAQKREDRTYRIIAFVEAVNQNTIPQRAVEAENLRTNLTRKYMDTYDETNLVLQDPSPETVTTPQIIVSKETGDAVSDSGIRPDLEFGGVAYHGFELQIRVREIW